MLDTGAKATYVAQVAVPGLGLGGIPRSTGRGIGGTESLASTCRDASFTSAMPPCAG